MTMGLFDFEFDFLGKKNREQDGSRIIRMARGTNRAQRRMGFRIRGGKQMHPRAPGTRRRFEF